jgi:alpha-mannosidase
MVNKFIENIGHYSGNKRLESSTFEELDPDNEKTREKWFGGKRELRFKHYLKRWCDKISSSIDPNKVKVHMVGQSHIDCAWMWRFEQTRKKAQVTFRKAILHAKLFPKTFCYALSEPLLLEWIKEDDPDLFKQIQETVKEGNIELVGGSYVEPDCMMPSGEAMTRQRLYGMRFYRDNFGILPKVEWFLDSFGYNFGLPQILIKSGAKYFWTTKLTWNLKTIFPFVNFWWQSPDGSQILTSHFHMAPQVFETWEKNEVGRHLLKKDGRKIWNYTFDYRKLSENVQDKICPHVGFFFGLSDGGHGPTHKEVAFANAYAKLSLFKWGRVEKLFNEIEKDSSNFPIWNDELYLENHNGCFSNHSDVKRHNRKYENLIISLESLAVLTSLICSNYQYPLEKLEFLWKATLKNQFHDVLAGSSIPEVYDELWDDWNKQDLIIKEIINEIGVLLSSQRDNVDSNKSAFFYLYNPLSWERTSRVFIPIDIFTNPPTLDEKNKPKYATLEILNKDNEKYICQPISAEPENNNERMPAGWWTVVKMKPFSLISAKFTILNNIENEEAIQKSKLEGKKNFISNDLVSIKINPNSGAIIELIAKNINNNKNLLRGESSNLTFSFLDDDKIFPAWNLTPEYWKYPIDLSNKKDVKIQLTEKGPIFTTLEIARKLGINPVTQKITLFNDCPEIFLEYLTNWQQKNVMLKILYSTTTEAETAIAEAAYCAIEFKTNPEVPCDIARFEKIGHKYFDLSTPDKKWGLAMLNEGKYAFDLNGGDIRLTLLRSCRYPPPAPEAWVNLERKENEQLFNHKVPEFSGLGPLKCRYALYPHKGGTLTYEDGTPNFLIKRKAEEFNNHIIIIPTKKVLNNDTNLEKVNEPLMEINTPNIYLGALKKNEWEKNGSLIARFYEGSGISSLATVKINKFLSEKISEIKCIDLLEREISRDFEWNKKTSILTFNMNGFEICSFEFNLFPDK